MIIIKFKFRRIIMDCITEGDGVTYDPMRIAFWIAFFAYIIGVNVVIGLDIYNTIIHPTTPPTPTKFDMVSAATGISAILAAGGTAILLKGVNGNAIPAANTAGG